MKLKAAPPAKRKPGRPKAEPTKPAMLRLTETQHKAYLDKGGARWVKRLLDEAKTSSKQPLAHVKPAQAAIETGAK